MHFLEYKGILTVVRRDSNQADTQINDQLVASESHVKDAFIHKHCLFFFCLKNLTTQLGDTAYCLISRHPCVWTHTIEGYSSQKIFTVRAGQHDLEHLDKKTVFFKVAH